MIKKYLSTKNKRLLKIVPGLIFLSLVFFVGMNVGKRVAHRRFKLTMQTIMTNSILNPYHLKTLKSTPINQKIKSVMNAHFEVKKWLLSQQNDLLQLTGAHTINLSVIKIIHRIQRSGWNAIGALSREEDQLADLGYVVDDAAKQKFDPQEQEKQQVKTERYVSIKEGKVK